MSNNSTYDVTQIKISKSNYLYAQIESTIIWKRYTYKSSLVHNLLIVFRIISQHFLHRVMFFKTLFFHLIFTWFDPSFFFKPGNNRSNIIDFFPMFIFLLLSFFSFLSWSPHSDSRLSISRVLFYTQKRQRKIIHFTDENY